MSGKFPIGRLRTHSGYQQSPKAVADDTWKRTLNAIISGMRSKDVPIAPPLHAIYC